MLLRSAIHSVLPAIVLFGAFQPDVFAHTVIDPPQVTEGKQSNNHSVITHGCGDAPVIGQSVVIPDGISSTIVANGNPHTGPLSDFLQNWGGITFVQDRSLFNEQDRKVDANGNTIGFWFGGGNTVASYAWGRIPFVSKAALFVPESCAKAVRSS